MQSHSKRTAQIFNETDPLEEVLVWGEPGCESLLGQLLPKAKSLFLSYYEVPEARQEFLRMQELIQNEGVTVLRAKDAYANLLKEQDIPDAPTTLAGMENRLLRLADEYHQTYGEAKARELLRDGNPVKLEDIYAEVRRDIHLILEQDAVRYGEHTAVKLNHMLCFELGLPVANIFYGRDQSKALGNHIVLSSMKWSIRRPETMIYEEALRALGFEAIVHTENGTLEGGDVILFENICYVGVGARTSLSGAEDVYRKIGHMLEKHDIQMVAVINARQEEEAARFDDPTDEHMQVMHLDMFWIPLDAKLVMAYGREMDRRRAVRVTLRGDEIVTEDLGSFREYHSRRGLEILEVNEQEQRQYVTNLLNMGHRKVLVALSKNKRVIAELERRGYTVLCAETTKLVGGYGAIHCMTAPVRRSHWTP